MTLINEENLSIRHTVCKDKTFEYKPIAGIKITKDFTEATDGHSGYRVTNPNLSTGDYPITNEKVYGGDVILNKKVIEKALKDIPKKCNISILKNILITKTEKNEIGLLTTDLETTNIVQSKEIEGMYPDLEEIYPTETPEIVLGIKLEQLEIAVKVLKDFKTIGNIRLSLWDPKSPIKLEAVNEKGQKLKGLIMPYKL